MENGSDKGVCMPGMHGCGQMSCGCGHHHRHALKWLIKIAVLVIVFSFAFKMGELKGMLQGRGFYGYGHNSGMMYGNDYYQSQGSPAEGAPVQ